MAAQVNPRGEGGKERHAIGSGDFCLYEKIPNKYLSNLGISKTQMFSIECDVVKRAHRIAQSILPLRLNKNVYPTSFLKYISKSLGIQ